MALLSELCRFLDAFASLVLSEEWDNVGLLVGDPTRQVERVMTCLTITPASCSEAVSQKADLIVTHHPLPFQPVRRLTTETTPGRLLLALIEAGISVYSPHTAYDSAAAGINQQLAEGLGLAEIKPLVLSPTDLATNLGSGRFGKFALLRQRGEQRIRGSESANVRIGISESLAGKMPRPIAAAGAAQNSPR